MGEDPAGRAVAGEGQRGTSLVELMVGIVAVITVLGSIISMTLQQSQLRRYDQELYLAYLAARNTLEEIRALPFSTLPSLDGTGFDVPDLLGNPAGLSPQAGDPDGLPGEIAVVLDQSVGPEQLYRVTLTVKWSGVQQRSEFEIQSLMGERKIQ